MQSSLKATAAAPPASGQPGRDPAGRKGAAQTGSLFYKDGVQPFRQFLGIVPATVAKPEKKHVIDPASGRQHSKSASSPQP